MQPRCPVQSGFDQAYSVSVLSSADQVTLKVLEDEACVFRVGLGKKTYQNMDAVLILDQVVYTSNLDFADKSFLIALRVDCLD